MMIMHPLKVIVQQCKKNKLYSLFEDYSSFLHRNETENYIQFIIVPESMMVEQPDQMQTRPSLYPQGPIVGGPFLGGPPRLIF